MDVISWIETYHTINGKKSYNIKMDKLHICTSIYIQVVNSPLKNYHVNIKDNTKCEFIKVQSCLFNFQSGKSTITS